MLKGLLKNKSLPPDVNGVDDILEACESYREKLIQYCQNFFGFDRETAADCVQEAYVALVENLKKGIKIHNYRAWLYKVVVRCGDKELKKKIKRNEYEFTNNEKKDKVIENLLSYNPNYVDYMISDERISKVSFDILNSLTENEKELYYAYYCERKKLSEIAIEFGISLDAVKKRNERLKKKLENKVKKFKDF